MKPAISVDNRFRLFYGFQFAGIGTFFPYIALYLKSLELTGAQVGLLLALMPFVAFLAQPLWGMASDVYHRHRSALVFACFGVAATMLLYSQATHFWLLLPLTLLHAIMMAPIPILSTSLALEHLGRQQSATSFGSLRLFGSIGFIITTTAIGTFLVDSGAIWWIMPLYAGFNICLALIAWTVPDATIHGKVDWRQAGRLLRRRRDILWLLAALLLIGMTLGIVNNYFIIYLRDIQATGLIIGLALALSALFEIPLMATAPKFVRRWGVRPVLIVCTAILPVRWLLYMLIDNPILVLPVQLLHGIAMMALLVVGILYIDRLLDPTLRASGQSLYAASLQGIGSSIGLYMAGLLYDWNGINSVWLFSVIAGLLGTLLLTYAVYGHESPTVIQGVTHES